MKNNVKRLLMFVLVFALTVGVIPGSTAYAASKPTYDSKVTIYLKGDPYNSRKVTITDLPGKITSVKSSKSSVVSVSSYENKTKKNKAYIYLYAKKAGTSTITFTTNGKKYTFKVTVKKYTNPAKAIKINGINNGNNFADKFKNKPTKYKIPVTKTVYNSKLKITAKKGWKITSVSYFNYSDLKQVNKKYKKERSSVTVNSCNVIYDATFDLAIEFTNIKNGGTIRLFCSSSSAGAVG